MKTILETPLIFNRHTAPGTWDTNKEYMEMFFKGNQEHINNLLNVYGFISIEKICEILGIQIDANTIDNTLVYRKTGKKLVFLLTVEEHEYVIQIMEVSGK